MDNSKYNYENDEKCDCNLSIEIFIIFSFYGKSEFKKRDYNYYVSLLVKYCSEKCAKIRHNGSIPIIYQAYSKSVKNGSKEKCRVFTLIPVNFFGLFCVSSAAILLKPETENHQLALQHVIDDTLELCGLPKLLQMERGESFLILL